MRKYQALRGLMASRDIDQAYLGQSVIGGLGYSSISHRFTGKLQWRLDEIYKVLDYFNVPHDQIPVYFPPNGRAEVK